MANTKSAIKRIRTSAKRHERNQAVKSSTRTFVRRARGAIGQNALEARADLLAAISALDRAARKGVIHRNNAARRKSRLMKRYNAAVAAATAPVAEPAVEAAPKARGRSATAKAPARGRTRKTDTPAS